MAEKITREKWYCTLRDGGDEKDFWSLKKQGEEPVGEFKTQQEAFDYFKKLNLTAMLWFHKKGKFVRTVKTHRAEKGEEQIVVDSLASKEEQEMANKLLKERERRLQEEAKNAHKEADKANKENEDLLARLKAEEEKVAKEKEKNKSLKEKSKKDLLAEHEKTSTIERRLIETEKQLQEEKAARELAEKQLHESTKEVEVVKEVDPATLVLLADERAKLSQSEEDLARERRSREAAERQLEEVRQTQELDLDKYNREVVAHERTRNELEELRKTQEIVVSPVATSSAEDEAKAKAEAEKVAMMERKIQELERRAKARRRLDESEALITVDDKTALLIIDEVEGDSKDDEEVMTRAAHQRKLITKAQSERPAVVQQNEEITEAVEETNATVANESTDRETYWGLRASTWYLLAKTVLIASIIIFLIVLAVAFSTGFVN